MTYLGPARQSDCSSGIGALPALVVASALSLVLAACGSSTSSISSDASVNGRGGMTGTGSGGTPGTGTGGAGPACGAAGQACCASSTCNGGGCCIGGMCVAAGAGVRRRQQHHRHLHLRFVPERPGHRLRRHRRGLLWRRRRREHLHRSGCPLHHHAGRRRRGRGDIDVHRVRDQRPRVLPRRRRRRSYLQHRALVPGWWRRGRRRDAADVCALRRQRAGVLRKQHLQLGPRLRQSGQRHGSFVHELRRAQRRLLPGQRLPGGWCLHRRRRGRGGYLQCLWWFGSDSAARAATRARTGSAALSRGNNAGICDVCGASGQACCPGNMCAVGFACVGTGGGGDGGAAALSCMACGATGQRCCVNRTCNAGLMCTGNGGAATCG